MKTLLIRPITQRFHGIGGQRAFPLGLGYIAAVLEERHDVKVIDMMTENTSDEKLKEIISIEKPGVVGITSDTLTFQSAIEVATLVKQMNRRVTVVMGGAHSNVLPDYPLRYRYVDISVYGEGERTAVELWDRLESGKSYNDVEGIAFRAGRKIVVNPPRKLIDNLDDIPFPARHLFPMDRYDDKYSPIGTSRGCPFSCAFCSNNVVWGRRYRYRSAKNVVDEIDEMASDYGIRKFYFREDLFTANRKRVLDLCESLMDKGIRWECESRVDTVDRYVLLKMRRAGCDLIWFGIESGSPRMLDRMNKSIRVSQVEEAYRACREVGIPAGASFIIGIPGETEEDIKQTVKLAKKIRPEFVWFNVFTGYPTSPLYQFVKEKNLYDEETEHGILVARNETYSRKELEKIQKRLSMGWQLKDVLKRIGKGDISELTKGLLALVGTYSKIRSFHR